MNRPSCAIRSMAEADAPAVLEMMRVFYASPAVFTNGSEEIFRSDIAACVGDSPYLEGYVFEDKAGLCGYAMLARSFSTEFGKPCVWIEDIYLKENCRSRGIGSLFFDFLGKKYPDCLLRLEAEEENAGAVRFYERHGFTRLPYLELKRG